MAQQNFELHESFLEKHVLPDKFFGVRLSTEQHVEFSERRFKLE